MEEGPAAGTFIAKKKPTPGSPPPSSGFLHLPGLKAPRTHADPPAHPIDHRMDALEVRRANFPAALSRVGYAVSIIRATTADRTHPSHVIPPYARNAVPMLKDLQDPREYTELARFAPPQLGGDRPKREEQPPRFPLALLFLGQNAPLRCPPKGRKGVP